MRYLVIFFMIFSFLSAKDRVVLFLSKTKLYLNEPILAKFVVKVDKKPKYITLEKFKDKNFYSKLILEGNITKSDEGYKKEFFYFLAPQATGDLTIEPIEATISSIQEKTGFLISNSYKTKQKDITVFSIPKGLNIAGDLEIDLTKDSNITKPNEPIYFTLTIKGYGNLDDIKAFELPIKGATYFSDKPTRRYKIVDEKLQGEFIQKFTVVADKSFSISPITLKYFNTQTELEEILSTKNIKIDIDRRLLSKREYIVFFVGFVLGIVATILAIVIRKKRRLKSSLELAIKSAKSDKELYRVLLPHANRAALKKFIEQLEDNIYNGSKQKIRKKAIIDAI